MTDDWPIILLSSGIGEGDRETKWEELVEDAIANPLGMA